MATVNPGRTHGTLDCGAVPTKLDRLTISIAQANAESRETLIWLLEKDGYKVVASGCGEEFLRDLDAGLVGCLVLDLELPDMTGLELLGRLRRGGCHQPCLFATCECNATAAVDLVRSGAIDVLVKPWSQERLLASVAKACLAHQRWRIVQTRLDRLSGREGEILELVIAGLPTKQIARRLNISPRTVDVHRSNISKKLEVTSFAALIQMIIQHELTGF